VWLLLILFIAGTQTETPANHLATKYHPNHPSNPWISHSPGARTQISVNPKALTACPIAGAAFSSPSGIIAGVASMLAFNARNEGSARTRRAGGRVNELDPLRRNKALGQRRGYGLRAGPARGARGWCLRRVRRTCSRRCGATGPRGQSRNR